jgi:4-hydroxy-3-methylbut-2-enyl diphosphate reductase
MDFEIYLARPRGFCAGVERAIETVKLCLQKYGQPIYVLHEIVHNKHVISELVDAGAIFVENLDQVPEGEVCIFSAHGVSKSTEKKAAAIGLRTVDATCPLVSSVHRLVEKYHSLGDDVIIIGHHNHPEVEGTAGRVSGRVHVVASEEEAGKVDINDDGNVGCVTQTTLCKKDITGIVSILKERFPKIKGASSNICFATQNRQDAVRQLAGKCELIFVVGSKNSSNSNRLREVAMQCGVPAHLIDDSGDIEENWLQGKKRIGITAGASAPERLVEGVIEYLKKRDSTQVIAMQGIEENIHFSPAKLH